LKRGGDTCWQRQVILNERQEKETIHNKKDM
jgi:hypothetical protein